MDETGEFRGFGPGALGFLTDLAANNDREWFRANEATYLREVKHPLIALVTDLSEALAMRGIPLGGDPKRALFRIHRDIRFSPDKRPYKTNAGAVLTRDGAKSAPGVLYVHLAPDGCFLAAGFHWPDSPTLASIRESIVDRPDEWRSAVDALGAHGLSLSRERMLQRLPRGFDGAAVGDLADDLRLTSFTVHLDVADDATGGPGLVGVVTRFAEASMPLLEFGWRAIGRVDA